MNATRQIEVAGVTLSAQYSEYGDRVTGEIRMPSGTRRGYEIGREGHGNFWSGHEAELTPEDRAVADRLFPLTPDRHTPRTFRRPSAELARVAWAAVEPGDWSPRTIALEIARRVPAGVRKEDFLPFVTAALQHFDAAQSRSLGADAAASSFAVANEQIQYREDFRRLTGRDFAPESDRITQADVEALPITPPPPPGPEPVYECMECGATYSASQARLIDAGGMGCVRCNH